MLTIAPWLRDPGVGSVDFAPMTRQSGAGGDPATLGPSSGSATATRAGMLIAFLVFAGVNLFVYSPALRGPLISDDFGYLQSPYTRSLDTEALIEMFDPMGDARLYTGNYAPVHLFLHALERSLFADHLVGYHVVNLLVHSLNSVLLVALLMRSGVPRGAALLGGAFFALHPANVEAVAWISQLKTNGALAFSLLALLCLARRPGLAALCFALALLTKASASFALPMAVGLVWADREVVASRAWAWLGVWALIFALYAVTQLSSFGHIGSVEVEAFSDPIVHLRTIAAVGTRYLVMAASSVGVAAFQEPTPVGSWLDPWWLAALPLSFLLAIRIFLSIRARREEAAWWLGAAAAFAPVSQLFPFLIPFADRYLYFILPGLIGGTLLCVVDLTAWLSPRGVPNVLAKATTAALSILLILFAVVSHERAELWQNEIRLLAEAARHYPAGGTAHYLRARAAAQEGDPEAAVESLRIAADLGMNRFDAIDRDPGFAPVRTSPAFRLLVRDLAGRLIERTAESAVTQPELLALARAHLERGETADAERALERAQLRKGPLDSVVRVELERLRRGSSVETP